MGHSPIRVALIGLGNSGGFYHLPHLLSRSDYQLVTVATKNPCYDTRIPGDVTRTTDWRKAISDPQVELVVVALPHHLHHPVAAAALDEGKHVLVEKPFTVLVSEADDLVSRAASAGCVIAVHHQRRYEADFVELTRLVAEGEIGRVWRAVVTRSHQGPYVLRSDERPHAGSAVAEWAHQRAAAGGIARVVGPHSVDHLLKLIDGDVIDVRARARVEAGEDIESWVAIDISFEGGVTGTVEAFRQTRIAPPRFAVYGDRGTAVSYDGQQLHLLNDRGRRTIGGLAPISPLGGEIYDDLSEAIRGGRELRVSVEDAVRVVAVLEAADRDLRAQGLIGPLPGELSQDG